MTPLHRKPFATQRGISLIEALVALAVMGFGMLAIVGIQSTMRLNSDVAKQRSEATRIAQEAHERWRTFSVQATTAGRSAYADIATVDDEEVTGYATSNTTYTLSRTATDLANQNMKSLQVTVSWVDRSGATQQVVLNSLVANVDPAALGVVTSTPAGNPSKRPRNRHASIPVGAKDMGNGTSAFKPPQAGGGTIAWVFNNTTGLITGLCTVATTTLTADLTLEDIESCSDNTVAHLLSGFVRFAATGITPDAAQSENPVGKPRRLDVQVLLATPSPAGEESEWEHPGDPECYDDAPATSSEAITGKAVAYYCLIPANTKRVWAGYATIEPLPFTDDPDSGWTIPHSGLSSTTHLLCRYTPATSDSQKVPNPQHPRMYRVEYLDPDTGRYPIPMPPLPAQNFLVVESAYSCPTDGPPKPLLGDFVNSNTLQHLPL